MADCLRHNVVITHDLIRCRNYQITNELDDQATQLQLCLLNNWNY